MAARNDQQADISCVSCRRLKRKCSKELPTCSLCCRVGRECVYQPPSSATLATIGQAAPSQTPGLQIHGSPIKSSLVCCFIDSVSMRGEESSLPDGMQWKQLSPNTDAISLDAAWATVGTFFETTYEWLPIVSRLRLSRALSSDSPITSADTQVLLHAMRLSVERSAECPSVGYTTIKNAILNLEQNAQFSTNFLAAYALLALYELGQGLYPAAYITVGSLARIFYALGFHDRRNATQILRRSDTWTETEERRRIWWAVLIFDRYMHAGFRFRPLATTSIPPDELLPASDEDWETGSLSINPLLVMSIEAVTSVSPFARACQAAHLLGRICEHVNQHPSSTDADFHFQEAMQLSRTVRALLNMIGEESDYAGLKRHRYFAARGLAHAGLSILYDVHSCVEPDDVEAVGGHRGLRLDIQRHAIDGFKQVSADMAALAVEIEQFCASGSLDKMPLVLMFPLHAVAGTFAWHARETGDEQSLSKLTHIKGTIEALGSKWGIASQYLSILEGQEYIYDGADCQ